MLMGEPIIVPCIVPKSGRKNTPCRSLHTTGRRHFYFRRKRDNQNQAQDNRARANGSNAPDFHNSFLESDPTF